MDRYGIVGVSWRQGGPGALARFTIPRDERAEAVPRLARRIEVSELVYLATCNRVEVAFVGDGKTTVSEYRRRIVRELGGVGYESDFRAWAGEGAIEHLFLVCCGLDSARPGETEIAGQLREACELARNCRLLGRQLRLAVEEALRTHAGLVRLRDSGGRPPSLAEIAMEHLDGRLSRTGGPVVLVGVSAMIETCARELARRDGLEMTLVNRTVATAESLSRELSVPVLSLADFAARPLPAEIVVTATGAAGTVLGRASLERIASIVPSGEAPLIVDFSIPPDVDPVDARRAGCIRLGMDDILREAEQGRSSRLERLADERTFVDGAISEFRRRFSERNVTPVIAALQRRYRRTAEEGVDRLFQRDLASLGEDERRVIRDWARTLARRFAHIPSLGLRGLVADHGSAAVDAFLSRLDDGLVRELRNGGVVAAEVSSPAGGSSQRSEPGGEAGEESSDSALGSSPSSGDAEELRS